MMVSPQYHCLFCRKLSPDTRAFCDDNCRDDFFAKRRRESELFHEQRAIALGIRNRIDLRMGCFYRT